MFLAPVFGSARKIYRLQSMALKSLAIFGLFFLLVVVHDASISWSLRQIIASTQNQKSALAEAYTRKDWPLVLVLGSSTQTALIQAQDLIGQWFLPTLFETTRNQQLAAIKQLNFAVVESRNALNLIMRPETTTESKINLAVDSTVKSLPRSSDGEIVGNWKQFWSWYNQGQSILTLDPISGQSIAFQTLDYSASERPYANISASDLLSLTRYALDEKAKYFLVFLANSDELRPAGGFFGSFAVIRVQSGVIGIEAFDDIYNLDNPAMDRGFQPAADQLWQENFQADLQFVRDRNWSVDGPTGLSEAAALFRQEWAIAYPDRSLPQFDGVAVITPNMIKPLMELAGPIEIEGAVFTPEQFDSILQYKVQQEFWRVGKSEKQRKDIVGDLGRALAERLKNLGPTSYLQLSQILQAGLERKDMYVSVTQPEIQNILTQQGWTAAITQIPESEDNKVNDYLAVFDANAKAQKTDAVMDKRLEYSVRPIIQAGQRKLQAQVILTYTHTSKVYSWRISPYRSVTRVLVPSGSSLISAQVVSSDLNQNLSIAQQEISGKTAFILPVQVDKDSSRQYILTYDLPVTLNSDKEIDYTLKYQTQPGRRFGQAEQGIFPNPVSTKILSEQPVTFKWYGQSQGVYTTFNGQVDRQFKLILTRMNLWR